MASLKEIERILVEAKSLARKYRELTGKPLGITGEIAEFTAAKILGLKLVKARQSGYDAIRETKSKKTKIQIKGRSFRKDSLSGQRVGGIQLDKEWDTVLLVLLDENLEVMSMYEAERNEVKKAILKPGSKARNERGALPVSWFKSHGSRVYLAK